MAHPDELLVDGELVVLHRRPHWRVLIGPVVVFVGTLGATGYLAALARLPGWQGWAWPALAALAVLLVGRLTVVPVVRWRTTHLVVTTRRVLVCEGVRSHQVIEVPLDRIDAVRTHSGPAGRLLGYGSLVIGTGVDGELELVDVPRAAHVGALLHRRARAGWGSVCGGDTGGVSP